MAEVYVTSRANRFCSSLLKSEPTRLHPEELTFNAKLIFIDNHMKAAKEKEKRKTKPNKQKQTNNKKIIKKMLIL